MGVSGEKETNSTASQGTFMDLKECIQDSPNFRYEQVCTWVAC